MSTTEVQIMGLSKKDREWVQREIESKTRANSVALPKQQLGTTNSIRRKLKQLGWPGAFVAVALFAFTHWNSFTKENAIFVGRIDEWTKNVDEKLRITDERLKRVEETVGRLGTRQWADQLVQAATSPTSPESQQKATEVLNDAKLYQADIPSDVVERTGQSFIEAAEREAGAWRTATLLIEYQSHRISLQFAMPQTGVFPQTTVFEIDTPPGKNGINLKFIRQGIPISEAARLQHIGSPTNPTVTLGPVKLIAQDGAIILDTMDIAHVIFIGAEIHYNGGPVKLEDVMFVNCKFVFTNATATRSLARNILSSETVEFSQSS
ncbi:MAG: hypothetical protein A3G20_02245 [Acidobacteria bacterium RIFCSPLOWO2_12_FULL_59_11]|nr:MAG: hypothetical protein A3G20_02245 [Acidobacteria bacterium RIFCSPLOWO2_12_FULL_59_11]